MRSDTIRIPDHGNTKMVAHRGVSGLECENTAAAFDKLVNGTLTFNEYREKETEVKEYLEKWFPVRNK